MYMVKCEVKEKRSGGESLFSEGSSGGVTKEGVSLKRRVVVVTRNVTIVRRSSTIK